MLKKTALEVGLFEPKTAMNYLSVKIYVGNKRSEDKLNSIARMHEEKSAEDSGSPTNEKRSEVKIKYWKVGLIEEIEDKLRERKIVIKDKDKDKEE